MAVVVILPPSGALRMACYNQQESDLTLPLLPPAQRRGRAPITPLIGFRSALAVSRLSPSCPFRHGVRFLASVHHRLRLLTFPMRTAVLGTPHSSTAVRPETSQVPARSFCT